MSADWRLELVDGVLHVDLTGGLQSSDFERLYDGILQEMRAVDGVLIDIGDAKMTGTGDFLLDSLVAQLRARDVSVTVLRRPQRIIEE